MLRFLGIGAQKAGTTWLYERLRRHPEVGFPIGKEGHYWDRVNPEGSHDSYMARFADAERAEGEITPAYGFLPPVSIGRLHSLAPDVRLIFLMRNPVERAWSSALMALGRAEMRYEEASAAWFLDHFRSSGSLARGDYAACIANWRAAFPPEQLLLLRHEEVARDPHAVLRRCCAHIGIAAPDPAMLEGSDDRVFSGPRHALPGDLRAALVALYRPRIAALEALLGESFEHWLEMDAADHPE